MANLQLKAIVSLLLLVFTITFATSARVLDEDVAAVPAITPDTPDLPDSPLLAATPATTSPVSTTGPAATTSPVATTGPAATTTPVATTSPVATTGPGATTSPVATTAPLPQVGEAVPDHALTFFMHDILGGSNPSTRAVTGIVTNPAANGQVPFAKPNGANLPLNNGVSGNNGNSGVINNNNIPFLTGLSGTTPNIMQNNGNNNGNNGGFGFSAVNGGQLPTGSALQKLMFGTMTAFDDELTEGHELGSGLIGKAQGFYIASSVDGTSQTMAFNTMFESGGYEDSLSFFGVHRIAVSESHLAVMGGTGKYVNAKGYATVKTFPPAANQQNTDGVETLLQISVYLTY